MKRGHGFSYIQMTAGDGCKFAIFDCNSLHAFIDFMPGLSPHLMGRKMRTITKALDDSSKQPKASGGGLALLAVYGGVWHNNRRGLSFVSFRVEANGVPLFNVSCASLVYSTPLAQALATGALLGLLPSRRDGERYKPYIARIAGRLLVDVRRVARRKDLKGV